MPGKKACNKIADPKERQDCLNYKGKYAKAGKMSNPKPMKKGGMGGGY